MSQTNVALLVLGTLMGIIMDLQRYRKDVAKAAIDNLPRPDFDWLCLLMHAMQGLSAGLAASAYRGA